MAFEFCAAMSNSSFSLINQGLNELSDAVSNDSIFKDFYIKNGSGYDSFTCEPFLTSGSVLQAEWFKNTAYFLYGIIFVVALVGNALVCYVVWSIPRMRTVTNYFIVNLAVSDILMTLFCVPTSFLSTLILQYWPFGAELCPIVNYAQAASVLVSAYTLIAISIDRYMAIMWPLKVRMSKSQAKLSILAVWVAALTISSPIAMVSCLFQPNPRYTMCNRYVCQEIWPSDHQQYYYSIALLILQYFVPLVVLMFTYTSIGIRVWGKRPPGEAENVRDQRMARSKRKVIKMMMTVVLVFTICWLPFNVLMLFMDPNSEFVAWKGLPYAWATLHWLAMSHSCYNPVIYCWMNARFRSGFITALSRIPGLRRYFNDSRINTHHHSDIPGMAMTGVDSANNSGLKRINTCTTYVSVRRKGGSTYGMPARSASFRYGDLKPANNQSQRHFKKLECQQEESI
ncbi:RYamide receptor-like isoform X2 [Cotesia glomerata]|uniref:RYamide receptor-like isoform X2 n=1 Tax=Cotesia glomerata TaxID=32391 RepID=UPI001D0157E2|nr:RYamide receptor-like isoform X2 [Cotesia glomerata]